MSRWHVITLIAQLESKRRLKDRRTLVAFGVFVGVVTLGAWTYWHSLPPRPEDDRLFGYGFLLACLLAVHLGIARDRRTRFDALLAGNFATPAQTYFAKIMAAMVTISAASLVAFFVALGTSLGDLEYSAWYSILFYLVTLVFLPFVALVETLLDIEYPVAVVALIFTAVISIVNRTGDATRVLHVIGIDVGRYEYSDLLGLILRAGAAVLLTAALYPLYWWRVGVGGRRVMQSRKDDAFACDA